jgi:hypothetical protein
MTAHADGEGERCAHGAGGPDDERCLAVLTLLMDRRAVEPELAAWARAHAAAHPACAAAFAELQALAATLASAPARRASPGFTGRVLARIAPAPARAAGAAAGARVASAGAGRAGGSVQRSAEVLPFVRRLALAAGLVLAVTLGVDLLRPAPLATDSGLQRRRHAADHFRRDALGPEQDIEAALRARLKDLEDKDLSVPAFSAPPAPPAPSTPPAEPGR